MNLTEDARLELEGFLARGLTDRVEENRGFEVRYSTQPYCPRFHYLATLYPGPRSVSGSEQAIFDSGHGLHHAVQNRLLNIVDNTFKFLGFIDDQGNYVEYSFDGEIPGHSDGLVWFRGRYFVLELKTCHIDKLLRMYEAAHDNVVQAQCYAKEFTQLGYPIAGVIVMYIERNRFEQYKLFILPVQIELADAYQGLVKYGRDCIDQGVIPDGICCNDTRRAAWCPFAAHCFALKNPRLTAADDFADFVKFIYPPKQPPAVSRRMPRYVSDN